VQGEHGFAAFGMNGPDRTPQTLAGQMEPLSIGTGQSAAAAPAWFEYCKLLLRCGIDNLGAEKAKSPECPVAIRGCGLKAA
jgi:hypothetical protein